MAVLELIAQEIAAQIFWKALVIGFVLGSIFIGVAFGVGALIYGT